jgi:Sporulation and spore germination
VGRIVSGAGGRRRANAGRALIALTLPAVLAVGLAACGIPTGDDTFSAIPDEDVPFGLDETSTTTSTTTTTTPLAPATTELATTTTIEEFREQVDVYFLLRSRLQPVPTALTSGFAPDQVVELLEAGPPPGNGLDTLIEPGLIVSTAVAGGVITIDLDREIFDRIGTSDQTEAIGQIVLTMTDNVDRVGFVLFTLDGEPTQVKKGDSLLSEPDEPVTFDDYANLLASTPPTPTTTTTVPETTLPAEPTPAEIPPDEGPATTAAG